MQLNPALVYNQMIHVKYFTAILIMFFVSACTNQTKTQSVLQKPVKMVGVRNARYCEILTVTGWLGKMEVTVYNTLGCNDCPATVWENVDQEKVKSDFHATSIAMNGPRVFLMDSIGQFNIAPAHVNVGGIDMIERAKLPIDLITILKGKINPYEERVIHRMTKYVFNKGSEVYFLHHGNHSYIMQSYAQFIRTNLTESALKTMANTLKLPEGWTYESKKLEKSLVLETRDDGEAILIQDVFQNSYQKIN
jgi:hypothetical protein